MSRRFVLLPLITALAGAGLAPAPAVAAETGIRTIAEIQGTGPTSPLAGTTAVTRGVVTAAYPTGGFSGFYLQTAGSGGDTDPSARTASDGIFVYGSAAVAKVAVGDHVEVTGKVGEFNALTQITPAAATDVRVLAETAAPARPATITLPRTAEQRETFEGMLLAPQGPFTVADNYTLNQYAEIGLTAGTEPLRQPTDVADAQDTAAITAVKEENAARKVTLDDGATLNFFGSARNTALPWLTQQREIRVGAPVSFTSPLVLDWRNNAWKLQPTRQVTAESALPATFGSTRTSQAPATGGNVRLASFNVLNYFPTTGEDFVAAGGSCTWYDDRAGQHVTVRGCTGADGGLGPRGAADAEDLGRQQAKLVAALNALDADVVSLEEIENSALFGKDPDDAVSRLVTALNADAGAGTWAFVPSPASAADQSGEDAIRTAFIYRPGAVEPIGESLIHDVPVFDVARDPLAQAFEPVGGGKLSRFAVIVNHFKSKGSGSDDGTGQGQSNPQRVAQAEELVRFADQVEDAYATEKVLLSGDFNAYTREDPIQVLEQAGYTNVGARFAPDSATYLFGGLVGSLDHVLASEDALKRVTGAEVWNINSVEPVALEYSRFNNNPTDFFAPTPFRASDHDPLVVGLELPAGPAPTTTSATIGSDVVERKADDLQVEVQVESAYGIVDGGEVEVLDEGVVVGTGTISAGTATIALPAYKKRKVLHELVVRYPGTEDAAASQTSVSFTVVK